MAATEDGRFADEIVPVSVADRKGRTVVDRDEHVRPTSTVETLATSRPIMGRDATVTAGNAGGENDGAAPCAPAGHSRSRAPRRAQRSASTDLTGATDRQAEVATRGAEVVPFDLEATTHRFRDTPTGGRHTVVADDPGDHVGEAPGSGGYRQSSSPSSGAVLVQRGRASAL